MSAANVYALALRETEQAPDPNGPRAMECECLLCGDMVREDEADEHLCGAYDDSFSCGADQ